MSLKIKTVLLMIAFLILAYVILQALATWAEIEATKGDDYFYVKSGWVSEPVLEVR